MTASITHIEYEELQKKCKRIGVAFPEEEAREHLKKGNTEGLRKLKEQMRRI